jgi:hypothetical protein
MDKQLARQQLRKARQFYTAWINMAYYGGVESSSCADSVFMHWLYDGGLRALLDDYERLLDEQ